MNSFVLTGLFAVALMASLLLKFWLATRQMRHVAAHRGAVPAPFAQTITLAAHQKAADYTLAKARFGLLSSAFGAAVLLGWTLVGGLDTLNSAVRDVVAPRFGGMAYQLALLAAFVVIGSALELPFDLYSTFRIEHRFGFNRMTWKLYVADMLKRLGSTEFATQEGTLYPLLSKMRREGLVDYEWQESDAGPPRKYYQLTRAGHAALASQKAEWNVFTASVAKVLDTRPAPPAAKTTGAVR